MHSSFTKDKLMLCPDSSKPIVLPKGLNFLQVPRTARKLPQGETL